MKLRFTTSAGDTTGMESREKKGVHKTWFIVHILIGANSDLHNMLRSNRQTGLSLRTKILDIGKAICEKGVTVVY